MYAMWILVKIILARMYATWILAKIILARMYEVEKQVFAMWNKTHFSNWAACGSAGLQPVVIFLVERVIGVQPEIPIGMGQGDFWTLECNMLDHSKGLKGIKDTLILAKSILARMNKT